MPGMDDIEATRRIAADPGWPRAHVVILTNYGLDRVAPRGDALLAPSITRKLSSRYVSEPLPTGTATG